MDLIVNFNDGQKVTMSDWQNWKKDYDGKGDILGLFQHYVDVNKELTFENPSTGTSIIRNAKDITSIEFTFE